ncbi:hypothetical protein [Rathayibacter soli]|uniref:hypothetical protein n=1 Tax=Rathayibacter soli TaxID=3144168 RepID=UPI0027E4C895|nr:hypothetical protein [Glaciibacter superstes]
MTTLSNNPFDTQPIEPGHFPAPDDPANIGLGATQPIDITALIADWDLQSRTSLLQQPSALIDQEQPTPLDHDKKAS